VSNAPDRGNVKSNNLPFTLTYAAPDPRPPSAIRGLINLAVIAVATGLICLTIWSLIAG
jgi:hypothetical protein